DPGRIVELTRTGRAVWSFGASSGRNRLDRPSLAIRLPNGLVAVNDDWRHRVLLIDPKKHRIVWQYGHTDVASAKPGYLDKPDGMDFLPAAPTRHAGYSGRARASASPVRAKRDRMLAIRRLGRLPASTSRRAAVAVPSGQILAVGGLVGGTSSTQILAGTLAHLRRIGSLPVATHDDAAVVSGRGVVLLYGGGQTVSVPTVVRIDSRTGRARRAHPLDEPLSDLGAAVVGGRTYLV